MKKNKYIPLSGDFKINKNNYICPKCKKKTKILISNSNYGIKPECQKCYDLDIKEFIEY